MAGPQFQGEQILFMPVGRYGAMPPGFLQRLSVDYSAAVLRTDPVRDEVREDLAKQEWFDELTEKKQAETVRRGVRGYMVRDVLNTLDEGVSVVHGGFLNHEEQRLNLKQMTKFMGVRSIALVFATGRHIANERVEWANDPDATDEERAIVPAYFRRELTVKEQLRRASNMQRRIQGPLEHREEAIILKGNQDMLKMMVKVARFFD